VITAILFMGCLTLLTAVALGSVSARLDGNENAAIERIERALPQTQCAQCGFPGCRPYAAALLAGTAELNQCPPGGKTTIQALSNLLNRPALAPDAKFGEQRPGSVATIDEDACIGCALCLQACPVDAILGAPHFMHTVIRIECTGCELCIAPCPVDCIALVSPNDRKELADPCLNQ
jgi:electron transport complex protein RnfB